jgi:type IV secretion system protein TrbL
VQVITSVLRREPAGLGRAAKGLLVALVMSVFAFSVTKILLGVVDQLSEGVVSYTMGTDIAGLGKRLALGSVEGVANPGLVLIFSLVILAAVAVVWAAMMIRKMLVIIAALLTPLAFSGATADITAGWVRTWIEFMAAMIASKLLLVIIFMIGVSVMEGAAMTAQPGPGQQLTQMATGSLILLLAGFAPWAAIKMFHFTGDALHTAHATATAAPSGARAVLSAPQKVNVMHSQASHAAAKFSGSGPRTPAGTQPPKDSTDVLNEKPTPTGSPGGPAIPAAADMGLPAASTAKPVGSAAGSSATGAGSSGVLT